MAGKGGGAWKVAYADFVTAMMAFFMVMWLTSQKPDVKQAVAGYFRDPFAIYHGSETGGADEAAARKDVRKQDDKASDSHVRALAPSGRDIDSRFTVMFRGNDAQLDDEARRYIDEFAPAIVGKLNRIELRGHCLRKPLPKDGPFKDRWQLCYARTQAVRDELERLGIEPQRVRLSQAEGNEPLSNDLGENELELNSRVDVILLPDYADIPWRKGAGHKAPAAAKQATAAPQHH